MWICIQCGLEVMSGEVAPEVDADGYYFICPGCDTRNPLVNLAKDGNEDLVLGQPPV